MEKITNEKISLENKVTVQPENFVQIKWVKEFLNIKGSRTVHAWCREGKIPHYKISGKYWFDKLEIMRWIKRFYVPAE